jgi:hypothetical protein
MSGTLTVGDKHVITKRERTMRTRWTVALGMLALVLAIGGWAEAVPVNTCLDTGNTQHIVDTALEAADIGANGYNNPACHLIIQVSITPITDPLSITAQAITVDPAGGPTPAVDVEIINSAASSVTTLSATGGNIEITNGILKAHKTLRLVATGDIITRLSELVAAADFGPPPTGLGDLIIKANGSVDIQTTAVHGGGILEVRARDGTITFICGGEVNGCRDPLLSSKAVELCGTCPPGDTCPPDPRVAPTIFPCNVTFDTQDELREVCFPVPPGVQCDGGLREKRFEANGNIDFTGTTLTSKQHITVTSNNGNFLAAGATITVTNDRLKVDVKGDGTSPSVDISDAVINTGTDTTILVGTGGPLPPAICINANGATINASNIVMRCNSCNGVIDVCNANLDDAGADFPTLNCDSTPPYNGTVLDEAPAECAVAATIN